MTKDQIKAIVNDAIDSGIGYTLEECNTGDCTLTLYPIHFHHEIPPPPIDPDEPKYVLVRGNESPKVLKRLKKKYGGNVEFLPYGTEVEPCGRWFCRLPWDC